MTCPAGDSHKRLGLWIGLLLAVSAEALVLAEYATILDRQKRTRPVILHFSFSDGYSFASAGTVCGKLNFGNAHH